MAFSTIDKLYNGTSEKLNTTSTGIAVTGTVAATAYTGDGSALTGVGSPSIDDNGNATAITIDSSENVMVGTANGSVANNSSGNVGIKFDGAQGQIQVTNVSDAQLYLNRQGTDGTIAEFRKDGTAVGSIGSKSGSLLIGSTDTYLRVNDPSDTIFPSNSSGAERDNTINLGKGSSRFKDLYLSGGVYLGGTGAANKLEDYEEGTWSPFWCNNAGQAVFSVNPNVNMARYIKIGRQVTASCYFNMPGSFSPSGNFVASAGLQIGGLPFTANSNGTNDYYSGTVGWYANFASSYNNVSSKTPIIYTKTNSNQIELGHANGIGHASTLQEHAYNSNSGILLTISYLTTS
jgi:hypothetical protein